MEGDSVELRLATFFVKGEKRYRGFFATKTQETPSESIKYELYDTVKKINSLGFTNHKSIFIPPSLMKRYQIEDDNEVQGVAILNFNKKKEQLGWKAVSIIKVGTPRY